MKIDHIIKDIDRLEKQIASCKLNLMNENFIKKAPPNVVVKEKLKLDDFKIELEFLKDDLRVMVYKILINKFGEGRDKFINWKNVQWYIEYQRERDCQHTLYSPEWFNYVYNENITYDELSKLALSIYSSKS